MNLGPGFGALAATDALMRATCLIVAAGLVSLAVRRRSPALSNSVWVFAFLGLCLIPLLTSLNGPRLALKVLPAVRPEPTASAGKLDVNVPSFEGVVLPAGPPSIESSLESGLAAADGERQTVSMRPRFRVDPTLAALGVWVLGALWVLFRLFLGTLRLRRLARRDTRPFAKEAGARQNAVASCRREAQALLALRISTTDIPPSAITWGAIRPTIVLPIGALDWAPNELEAVLLHELAHVRRKDSAKQLLAELACALYWFHPLVWLGARAMRLDAELAADEDALRSGIAPSEYASALLQIARGAAGRTSPVLGAGVSAMTHPRIDKRLRSILSPTHSTRGMTRVQSLAALLLMGCAVTAFTAIQLEPQGADAEAAEAMHRARQLGTAAVMYAADYNDVLPYVQSTASVVPVLAPYARNNDVFLSPAPGGRFLYNINVGGVRYGDIPKPAETPLWVERLSGGQVRVVTFVDSHVQLISASQRGQIESALKWTFKRRSNSRPLPKGHLINDRTVASSRVRSLIARATPIANGQYAPTAAVAGSARVADAPLASTGSAASRSHPAPVPFSSVTAAGSASAPARVTDSLGGAAVASPRSPLPSQGGIVRSTGGLDGTLRAAPGAATTLPSGLQEKALTTGSAASGTAPLASVPNLPGTSVASPGVAVKADLTRTRAIAPQGAATLEAPAKTTGVLQAGAPTTAVSAGPLHSAGQATTPAAAPAISGQSTAPAAIIVDRPVRASASAPAAIVERAVAPTMYRWDGKGFVPVYSSAKPSGRTPKPGLYQWDGRRYIPVPASKSSAKRKTTKTASGAKPPIKK
ncbi:MAG: hypothetical protein HZC36_12375 [Armatimonadetes bacterium]|nr:hypothetical protein [Armatimonadota bacterium]